MSLTEKLLFLSVGFLIIIFIAVGSLNKSDKLKLLKEKYEAALRGSDKTEAIAAGQDYYRYLRGGELTIEDERVIFKDTAHLPEEEGEEDNEVTG